MPPVCPHKSSCTMYEASTHHLTTGILPTLKTSLSLLVTLRYFNTRFIPPPVILFWFLNACGEEYHRHMYVLVCYVTHEHQLCYCAVKIPCLILCKVLCFYIINYLEEDVSCPGGCSRAQILWELL